MTADQIQLGLILITLMVAGYSIYHSSRQGEVIDGTQVLEAVTEGRALASQLMEVAQIAVNATEQLKREGRIESNDVAFNHALDLVKKWVPDEWEVDNEDIIAAINAAVLTASALSRQAGNSSEDASPAR